MLPHYPFKHRQMPGMTVVIGLLGLSVLLLGGCSAQRGRALEFYGTTEPFASEAVYFVVTDRFVDGDSSNNQMQQGGDMPTFDLPVVAKDTNSANVGYLGGDFQGILDQADYIRQMGFTSIWITPIVDNPDQSFAGGDKLGEGFFADNGKTGYHGYWGVNFYRTDEHLPSPGLAFSDLTEQLQHKGLKLVLDIVANHGSPSFSMPEDQPGFGELYDVAGRKVADHQNLEPEMLDHTNVLHQWFHREKDLAQLSNLNENNSELVDYLINSYLHWIDQGAAAFRIDTIKHMPHSFWKQLSDRVRQQHPGFFMFAESFSYDAAEIAQHMQPENGAISVLDFPGRQAMVNVFENRGSDFSELLDYLHLDDKTYPNPYDLMTFYDNHDMARLNASDDGFVDVHNWLFTSRGIPVIYYGSEIGFMRGAKEHYGNRNYFGLDNIETAKSHRIRQGLKAVADIRKSSIALQKGLQVNLDLKGDRAVFLRVYQRGDKAQTALVMLNKGDEALEVSAQQFVSRGTWVNAQNPNDSQLVGDPGQLVSMVPPHSFRIWLFNDRVNDQNLLDLLAARILPASGP